MVRRKKWIRSIWGGDIINKRYSYHRVVAFGDLAEKIANEFNQVGREYKIKGKMIRQIKIKADCVENGRLSKKLREQSKAA